MGAEQYRRFVEAEKKKLASKGRESTRKADAVYAHARYMAPKKEALDRAHVAGILRETTNILLRGYVNLGISYHNVLETVWKNTKSSRRS